MPCWEGGSTGTRDVKNDPWHWSMLTTSILGERRLSTESSTKSESAILCDVSHSRVLVSWGKLCVANGLAPLGRSPNSLWVSVSSFQIWIFYLSKLKFWFYGLFTESTPGLWWNSWWSVNFLAISRFFRQVRVWSQPFPGSLVILTTLSWGILPMTLWGTVRSRFFPKYGIPAWTEEWRNDRINEWRVEWPNELMNECLIDWLAEWLTQWVSILVTDWTNDSIHGWMND